MAEMLCTFKPVGLCPRCRDASARAGPGLLRAVSPHDPTGGVGGADAGPDASVRSVEEGGMTRAPRMTHARRTRQAAAHAA